MFTLAAITVMMLHLGDPVSVLSSQLRTCVNEELPTVIRKHLQNRFPTYRFTVLSDLDEYDQKLWEKAHGNRCPGIAVGHFRPRRNAEFGILLIRHDLGFANQVQQLLLFASVNEQGDVELKMITEYRGARVQVISVVPPGVYWSADRSRKIETKYDSLLYETIEAGATLIYWQGGRFRKLLIAE